MQKLDFSTPPQHTIAELVLIHVIIEIKQVPPEKEQILLKGIYEPSGFAAFWEYSQGGANFRVESRRILHVIGTFKFEGFYAKYEEEILRAYASPQEAAKNIILTFLQRQDPKLLV